MLQVLWVHQNLIEWWQWDKQSEWQSEGWADFWHSETPFVFGLWYRNCVQWWLRKAGQVAKLLDYKTCKTMGWLFTCMHTHHSSALCLVFHTHFRCSWSGIWTQVSWDLGRPQEKTLIHCSMWAKGSGVIWSPCRSSSTSEHIFACFHRDEWIVPIPVLYFSLFRSVPCSTPPKFQFD